MITDNVLFISKIWYNYYGGHLIDVDGQGWFLGRRVVCSAHA